ncbi:MAG: chitobiase/beta-hexosaminidase C-terminal domain-containing protein [candidate division KSB1 bacterium]|nr:chitobiase/beta-hexosaminidase C-terminal domain-containing protein [candidate division KSB1 bacterium]
MALNLVIIPTTKAGNQLAGQPLLPPPKFSHQHGFYETPFDLEITTTLPKAQIFYTTDGSEPGENNGTLYTSPVSITTTTVLRAIVKADSLTSKIATATYLFLEDVINQPNNPPGYPSEWGPYTAIPGTAIADYEMDPEITQDPRYAGLMKEALLSIPTMSIVTDRNNLFSKSTNPDSGGIYIYTGPPGDNEVPQLGDGWERPASVEFFNRDGSEEFQIDCGIQIQGGHSRRPEKSPKHSFRLVFKSKYGPTKLNYPLFGDQAVSSFNTITLRAGFGNTWHHWSASERKYAQYIRDVWAKDTQLAMGHPAGHGRYVHLYLNGIYWGVYNPTERIDKEFAADYLGGNADDYDVIKDYSEVVDGNKIAWNKMMSLANKGLADNISYQRIQGKNPDGTLNPNYEAYVDVVNLIDYMILNFYGGNWDWDHHNWVAVRNRVQPGKGFKFFSWDAEHILEEIYANVLNENNNNCPSQLFQRLRENADFRRLFADRVQLHCFNGGVLTPESAKARWMARAEQIDLAIIAESARWGDYRRDVHRYISAGPFDLYDKQYWLAQQSFLINQYFPQRTAEFIAQLKQANLFPKVDAPQFLINGQPTLQPTINSGDTLSMTVSTGTIYYTMDGTDPLRDGQVSLQAVVYSKPIKLIQSTYVKARTLFKGEWSALNEKIFVLPTDIYNLKVTEIHYHPLAQDSIDDRYFEFIELKNTGPSPLDLSGVQFCKGISYSFPIRTILQPNEFIVLASNQFYFTSRYRFAPFGEYDGFLDNAGERIVMINSSGDTIVSIRYNDKAPWPEAADGDGYSLVLKDPNANGDPNNPDSWRASYKIHGSPGTDDMAANINRDENKLPFDFQLGQNYPNPFNAATVISYQVAVTSHVTLKVYDILGREAATLVNEVKQPGIYRVSFSITEDRREARFSSGVYIYRIQAGDFSQSKKMILIK